MTINDSKNVLTSTLPKQQLVKGCVDLDKFSCMPNIKPLVLEELEEENSWVVQVHSEDAFFLSRPC
jgi:hypothetical protein